jgi:hypothetical protein
MLAGDPSDLSPGESRALLPVIGVSAFFIITGPRHIQIPTWMPRHDSVQKAILLATREVYVAKTTSSRKLAKTNRTGNSSGGGQAGKRCAGCDRTGSLEICAARMVWATAQPANPRDLSRTATTRCRRVWTASRGGFGPPNCTFEFRAHLSAHCSPLPPRPFFEFARVDNDLHNPPTGHTRKLIGKRICGLAPFFQWMPVTFVIEGLLLPIKNLNLSRDTYEGSRVPRRWHQRV